MLKSARMAPDQVFQAANAPSLAPPVSEALVGLAHRADHLHKALYELEDRLQSVLAVEGPCAIGQTAGQGIQPDSPKRVFHMIVESSESVESAISRIHNLIGRLEI